MINLDFLNPIISIDFPAIAITRLGNWLTSTEFYFSKINDEYPETDLDVETAVRIGTEDLNATLEHPHIKVRNAPAEKNVAAHIYEGPYRNVGSAVLVLLNWTDINEWNISGAVRELHLSGPAHAKSITCGCK